MNEGRFCRLTCPLLKFEMVLAIPVASSSGIYIQPMCSSKLNENVLITPGEE